MNVLTESGIIRGDITTSFESGSAVAKGILLTIKMTVLDACNGGEALAGAAIYVWHGDIDGNYSMYSEGARSRVTWSLVTALPPARHITGSVVSGMTATPNVPV